MYKTFADGRQPASLTPSETEFSIFGTDEAIKIPVLTSTKVYEIKELFGARLGIDPYVMKFMRKSGCSFRAQYNHEEIARKVVIKGIPSFKRQRVEYTHPHAIIGAGHIGLRHALWFIKTKQTNFVGFDRRDIVGGTSWINQANKTSKLQTELGTYHLQYDEDYSPPKDLPPWPSRDQLLAHFKKVAEDFGIMPYYRMNTNVKVIEAAPKDGTPEKDNAINLIIHSVKDYTGFEDPVAKSGQKEVSFPAASMALYPGNLTIPRRSVYKGEEQFGGVCEYAVFDDVDYARVEGQTVVILGHGAFAVENVRTCCEFGAKRIKMVCRRTNLSCPRIASWYCNQSEMPIPAWMWLNSVEPAYKLVNMDPWEFHSVSANSSRTSCTVTQKSRFGIGDVYFISTYMGLNEVIIDDVKRLTHHCCHLLSGRTIECQVLLKLLGFHGAFQVDQLLKLKQMYGFWVNGDNRRYCVAEPIGVNANSFAGTSLSPGAVAWVEQAAHCLDYPEDWRALKESRMLPTHEPEPENDRPGYVIDARQAMVMSFTVPQFCPQIADHGWTVAQLKHQKQIECHPPKIFLEQCAAEWAEYGKTWKARDPTLKDVPPYPYTWEMLQDLLEKEQVYKNARLKEMQDAAARSAENDD
mmetsp:Transcript_29155/g.53686  ORF Transcript_29155/g.53686 Transcript_29155/m.53686 type:complete len:636 (-) Transcript_29155:69-1976(-)